MTFPTRIVCRALITSIFSRAKFRNTKADVPGIAAIAPGLHVRGVLAQTQEPARRDQ
jgi:hypothetical protein